MTHPKTALIVAAAGIGDVLRVTPLIRVVHGLGYTVDVLLAPDDPTTGDLLRNAPEIRFLLEIDPKIGISHRFDWMTSERYDVALFTARTASLRAFVKTRKSLMCSQYERGETNIAAVTRFAEALGWRGTLPPPFAMRSERRFDIEAGTVALHPGCKPNWPWKKWHGFDELANRFRSVVIVGSDTDLSNEGTYFARTFRWPKHARDFTGLLSLCDTAALLSQCTALISPDSGMMHLAAALGIPTFGIFGITSPDQEALPLPHMFPISKGLPCEAACRRGSWGRRDCDLHLKCLRTLTPDEVYDIVKNRLAEYCSVWRNLNDSV